MHCHFENVRLKSDIRMCEFIRTYKNVTRANPSAIAAASCGRTTRATSTPSRRKIKVGHSLTVKDRPSRRPRAKLCPLHPHPRRRTPAGRMAVRLLQLNRVERLRGRVLLLKAGAHPLWRTAAQ